MGRRRPRVGVISGPVDNLCTGMAAATERMVRISPLPENLAQMPFTVYESRELGVSAKRLRARDLSDGGRLIYLPASRHLEVIDLLGAC